MTTLFMKSVMYTVGTVIALLLIALLVMELFGVRFNYHYFQRCNATGQFGNIACSSIPLFRPK